MVFRKSLCSLFIFLIASAAHAAAPGVYAITGGTVHRVSGPPIENGTVIIRSGLIEAVGSNLSIPADATVIDAKGGHVYPGLFDAQTSIGLPAAPRRRSGSQNPNAPAEPQSQSPTPSPAFIAAQHLKLDEDALNARRSRGVTTVVVASSADIFNGQSAIVNLSGEPTQSMVIRNPASMQISFSPRSGFWTFPSSLMGVIAHVRQTLLDAQHNENATTVYARNPAGKERPAPTPDLEALRSVLRRELPVVFIANDQLMIQRAAEIAREFNLRWILSGGRQSYRMADALRQMNVPVLVSVDWPKAPSQGREDQPLRVIRDRALAPTAPAELAKRNVQFALVSGNASAADFLRGIRKAVDKGLNEQAALRAVTLSPAQIFGVDRQIGSLDRGKIANVFISDKRFFDRDAKVTSLFIDGRRTSIPPATAEAGDADSPMAGTWNVTIRAPEREVSMQLILSVDGDRLSGTFSGDRGSGDIREGTVEGSSFRFVLTTGTDEMSEASDWVFEGTVEGSAIRGSVTTTIGVFQFSGSKAE